MKRYFVLYLAAITIPFFLGLTIWQTARYDALRLEVKHLEEAQLDRINSNRRLIAEIAELSSPQKIEKSALKELKLHKIRPEDVLQVRIIEGGKGHEL